MRLTEKYKPSQVAEFIGLEEPKKIIGKWLENPYPTSFLFVGDSGTGKTQMGHAIARALNADGPYSFIHVPSQKCNVTAVAEIQDRLIYVPWGDFWVVLIDEADQMTSAAQIAFLSLLDSIPERTVIIFTCNETDKLEPRFLSRCATIKFSNYGLNSAGSAFLRDIWSKESGAIRQPALMEPDFARLMKNCRNNLRDALMHLEMEIMSA